VAAARLADVGAADPQPAVRGGVGEHRTEEIAVGRLDGVALGQRAARLGEATGERIADLLELAQVEHPRRPRGDDPMWHVDPTEPRGDQSRELQLQLPDLPPQLCPGQTLIDRDSVEYSPHGQSLSGLEGRCSNP